MLDCRLQQYINTVIPMSSKYVIFMIQRNWEILMAKYQKFWLHASNITILLPPGVVIVKRGWWLLDCCNSWEVWLHRVPIIPKPLLPTRIEFISHCGQFISFYYSHACNLHDWQTYPLVLVSIHHESQWIL